MKEAGFGVIFCNIKDYAPESWQIVRDRAKAEGVVCGPWARTTSGSTFEPELLTKIQEVADRWGDTPYIVNSESELNGTGSELTSYIQQMCGADDYALSMEPTPFANTDWTPIKAPVLPQCFGPDYGSPEACERVIAQWQGYGVKCVVPTFGTYNQWQPDVYPLLSPYGLYTADDVQNNFQPWKAKGTHEPCVTTPAPIPPEDGMEKIGSEHGAKAWYNRMKVLDPDYCTPEFDPENYDAIPPKNLKAHSKLCRTLLILAADHDELLASQATKGEEIDSARKGEDA